MSTMAPEAPAPRRPSSGGRAKGIFTNKIGPLPMWGWVAIVGGGFLAYRWYSGYKANQTSASTADTGVSSDQVPQFVNQTYTTVTPPTSSGTGNLIIPREPPPLTKPPVQPGTRVKRSWTAPRGGVSTLAEIAQRLTGRPDASLLTPTNATAQKFIEGPFKKNKNAKVPKGASFSYLEGAVA